MTALLNNPGVRDAVTARDAERLQGVWNFVTGRRKVQLFINGDHFTAKFNNGDVYEGTFDLDPTKKPAAIDLVRDDKEVLLGIYVVDGDTLRLAMQKPGGKERPTAFESPEDSEVNVFVLKREKK